MTNNLHALFQFAAPRPTGFGPEACISQTLGADLQSESSAVTCLAAPSRGEHSVFV